MLTSMAARPMTAMYFTSQTGEVWRFVFGTPPEKVLDLTTDMRHADGSELDCWASRSTRGSPRTGFSS